MGSKWLHAPHHSHGGKDACEIGVFEYGHVRALEALTRMQGYGLPFAVVKLMLIFQNRQEKCVTESGHACTSKSCVELCLGNKVAPVCWFVCVCVSASVDCRCQ